MSECHWLSDRMPAVALGTAEWTPDEVQHLNACQECQGEWELVLLGSGLGRAVGLGLDPGSVSDAVQRRLQHARAGQLGRRAAAGVAAAAVVAAVLWTSRPAGHSPAPPPAVVAGLQLSLPELDNLQPAELDSVLRTMDEPVAADSTLGELEGFLDSWEG